MIVIRGRIVLVDDEDLPVVRAYQWKILSGYAVTRIGVGNGKRRTIGMHRLLLGDPKEETIDHINRNRLDNRKTNLLPCSRSTNNKNRPTFRGKSSKYRGVSFNRGRWQVVVRVNGRLKWLGSFCSEEEAGKVAAPHFSGIAA